MAPVCFSCTLCGDCCTGAQVVRLTDSDRVRLTQRVGGKRWADLRKLGLVSLVLETLVTGQVLWRPRLRFRTKPLVQCPFLVNDIDTEGRYRGLCSLHPFAKPLVCQLSPLARDVELTGKRVQETWSIVPPTKNCPGMGLGPVLEPSPPLSLRPDLDHETRWIRWLLSWGSQVIEEEEAWKLLESWA